MAGLQRSTETFRRSGSSGQVWEDRFLAGKMNAAKEEGLGGLRQSHSVGTIGLKDRSRPTAVEVAAAGERARGYRAEGVTPALDPPSPKVSCCGLCGGDFSKSSAGRKSKARRR
ncbi:Uncharacterized protein AXF42_Ash010739 [Apostasia shenzhenica]|uniref:MAPK kinase substrate protein n=1 Tax=Apostasia shenzhenica TaxID=1088818 RepID=A0A2I0A0H9_9ASPA|nr:Uncharacterized protein AXF42_Ash010739 [Apostasia shenzhenica]